MLGLLLEDIIKDKMTSIEYDMIMISFFMK